MFDEIGEGVYRRRYVALDLNIGVVVGDDGVLLVDTRSSQREAVELRDELAALTSLPVRWIVNTHWHFDHVFGNATFADAEIWGHELCQIALRDHAEDIRESARKWVSAGRRGEIDDVEIVPPAKVFGDEASLDIGRRVDMGYHGFGHTDADIVVSVPGAEVAFFGDLIEEGAPPVFGDGYPVAWPLTLRLAANEMPETIVPGHGDVVGPAFVRSQIDELSAVADLATSYVTGAVDIDEAASVGPYGDQVMRAALLRAQAVAT